MSNRKGKMMTFESEGCRNVNQQRETKKLPSTVPLQSSWGKGRTERNESKMKCEVKRKSNWSGAVWRKIPHGQSIETQCVSENNKDDQTGPVEKKMQGHADQIQDEVALFGSNEERNGIQAHEHSLSEWWDQDDKRHGKVALFRSN